VDIGENEQLHVSMLNADDRRGVLYFSSADGP
jgi:hypothetical protein